MPDTLCSEGLIKILGNGIAVSSRHEAGRACCFPHALPTDLQVLIACVAVVFAEETIILLTFILHLFNPLPPEFFFSSFFGT